MKPYPPSECPRFESCSVNICPLDPDVAKRNRITGEPHCTMAKVHRVKVGSRYPDLLPLGGMKPKEFAAKERWESLTDEERNSITSQLDIQGGSKNRL